MKKQKHKKEPARQDKPQPRQQARVQQTDKPARHSEAQPKRQTRAKPSDKPHAKGQIQPSDKLSTRPQTQQDLPVSQKWSQQHKEQTMQSKSQPQQIQEQQKKQRQRRDWKAYIYNSPYLILITLTSLAVMFTSDEIGIRAVARETQMVVSKSYAQMPGESGIDVSQDKNTGDMNTDDKNTGDMNAADDGEQGDPVSEERTEPDADPSAAGADHEKQTASASGDTDGAEEETLQDDSAATVENAGIRKDENDDLQNDGGLHDGYDSPENGVESAEVPPGVTNFEFYEPVPIESRYYKDAGKVALTTDYSYKKENISYFDDAAFLGDSRTLGISDYAGLEGADFYCDSGMMIFKILEEEVTYQKTGSKVRMDEVLQKKQYGKIYIMLGMNELGYGNTEMYLEQYRQVLKQIRTWQPEAVIYIMANLHVSREKNNMETEFNNININAKNAASASLANGTDVFYLDVNPVFTDEEGYLRSELTFDGVHLYAKHYDAWREFLLEHAVEPAAGIQDAAARNE